MEYPCANLYTIWSLRYFVPQIPITGKMLNGYLMFSVKSIVQNVKLIELWGNNLVPLHFVISKSSFFWFFPENDNILNFSWWTHQVSQNIYRNGHGNIARAVYEKSLAFETWWMQYLKYKFYKHFPISSDFCIKMDYFALKCLIWNILSLEQLLISFLRLWTTLVQICTPFDP